MKSNRRSDRFKITCIILVVLTLVCLVAIGSFTRFHNLDAWGLWFDEHLTQDRAHLNCKEIVKHRVASRTLAFHNINSFNGWAVKNLYDVTVLNTDFHNILNRHNGTPILTAF